MSGVRIGRRGRVALLGLACWGLGSVGCAQTAEERQLAKMREELDHVEQSEGRFDERLSAIELHDTAPPAAQAPSTPTPPLRVVRLAPDGSEESEASSETAGMAQPADDTSARPVLKVTGGGRRGGKELVEQTMPDESAAPSPSSSGPRPSALDPEARKAYDAALALVNGKKYTQALDAFAGFLLRYPDHPYASNATYWRGECYFAQGDYLRAAEQFDAVVTRYPLGNKSSDALLKLGMTQQKLGNPQKAKEYFDRLQREYPRSDAARRIPTQGSGEAARPKGAGPEENP